MNKRLVYAMRSIGRRHASMKRFCTRMNMPPRMQFRAYRDCNIALLKAANSAATKTKNDAAVEVHGENPGQIIQCSVSCDCT